MSTIAEFAGTFAALYAAHMVGDHFVQTHKQACGKGAHSAEDESVTRMGRMLCLQHVASLTGTKAVFILGMELMTGTRLSALWVVLGLVIDAASHYWADRRFTLAKLCEKIGKGDFYRLGTPRDGRDDNPSLGTGAYALDQSWHIGWLFVAALIMAL